MIFVNSKDAKEMKHMTDVNVKVKVVKDVKKIKEIKDKVKQEKSPNKAKSLCMTNSVNTEDKF